MTCVDELSRVVAHTVNIYMPEMSSRHDDPSLQSENPRSPSEGNQEQADEKRNFHRSSASLAASDSSRLPLSALGWAAKGHVWALSLAFLLALGGGLNVPGNNHPALWDMVSGTCRRCAVLVITLSWPAPKASAATLELFVAYALRRGLWATRPRT